jgi:hypothetical protein
VGPTGNPTNFIPPVTTNTTDPTNVVVQVTPVTTTVTNPVVSGPAVLNPAEVVVPALLRLVSGDANGVAGLPGGSFLVLGTGPLGGVRDASPSGALPSVNRLSLPGDDQHTDAATSPALFVQDGLLVGGDGVGAFINWEPILRGYRRLLEGLWRTGIEEVPAGEDEDVIFPTGQEEAGGPAAAVGDEADGEETALAFAPSDATWCSLTANRLLVPGLFILGALGVQSRDGRRGPRPGIRGPWSVVKDRGNGHY